MKRLPLILLLLAGLIFSSSASLQAADSATEHYQTFSKNLVKALKSSNTGLQHSAMQLVIEHGDKVDVSEAVFDVMLVFRFDDNPKVRQLALQALSNMDNEWAQGFLKRQIQFEEDPVIRHQLKAIAARQ